MLAPTQFAIRPTVILGNSETLAVVPSLSQGVVVAEGSFASILLATLAKTVSEGFTLTILNTSSQPVSVAAQADDLLNGSLGNIVQVDRDSTGVLTMVRLDNTERTPAWWLTSGGGAPSA